MLNYQTNRKNTHFNRYWKAASSVKFCFHQTLVTPSPVGLISLLLLLLSTFCVLHGCYPPSFPQGSCPLKLQFFPAYTPATPSCVGFDTKKQSYCLNKPSHEGIGNEEGRRKRGRDCRVGGERAEAGGRCCEAGMRGTRGGDMCGRAEV